MAALNSSRRITLPPIQAIQDHYEYYGQNPSRGGGGSGGGGEAPLAHHYSQPILNASTNPYSQSLNQNHSNNHEYHHNSRGHSQNSRDEYSRGGREDEPVSPLHQQEYRPRSEQQHHHQQHQFQQQQQQQQQSPSSPHLQHQQNQNHHQQSQQNQQQNSQQQQQQQQQQQNQPQYHHHHDERDHEHEPPREITREINDSPNTRIKESSRQEGEEIILDSKPRSYKDNHPNTVTICRPFITKLAFLLETAAMYGDVLEWNEEGTSFVITICEKLTGTILPEIFSHKSVAAFHRQLTTYGFFHLNPTQLASQFANHKSSHAGTLIRQRSGWSHPHFTRDREEDRTKLVPRPSKARAAKQLTKALLWSAKTNAESISSQGLSKERAASRRAH